MAVNESGFVIGDWIRELVTGALVVVMGWLFTIHNARRKAVDVRLDTLEKGHNDQAVTIERITVCQENTKDTLERLEGTMKQLNENITRTLQASLDRMPGGKRRTD